MTSHPIPQELDPGLTEAEAAAAIGWSIPNLRSYRERWAAGRVAEALTHAEREAILALGKAGTLAPPVPPGLVRHKLVRPVDPPGTARPSGSVELTQRGREVLHGSELADDSYSPLRPSGGLGSGAGTPGPS